MCSRSRYCSIVTLLPLSMPFFLMLYPPLSDEGTGLAASRPKHFFLEARDGYLVLIPGSQQQLAE